MTRRIYTTVSCTSYPFGGLIALPLRGVITSLKLSIRGSAGSDDTTGFAIRATRPRRNNSSPKPNASAPTLAATLRGKGELYSTAGKNDDTGTILVDVST